MYVVYIVGIFTPPYFEDKYIVHTYTIDTEE